MKKLFLFLSFVILINAQDINNSTLKNEEKQLNNKDDSSKKLLELQEKVKKAQARTESLNKLEKTVNEMNDKLGIKK